MKMTTQEKKCGMYKMLCEILRMRVDVMSNSMIASTMGGKNPASNCNTLMRTVFTMMRSKSREAKSV